MSRTVNLTLKKSGYVKASSAGTVFPTNTSTWYLVTDDDILYFGFNAISSSLRRKKLQSCRLRVFNKTTTDWSSSESFFVEDLAADFDPASLTYNNKPSEKGSLGHLYGSLDPNSEADVWATSIYSQNEDFTHYAINYGVKFEPEARPLGNRYFKTRLSGGGLPYLEVTYDESVNVTSKVSNVAKSPSGTQNPGLAATFTWDLVPDGARCADEKWTQASAKLYWKKSTDSTWNVLNISGSTQRLTVPAGTFPSSSTIQYYVQATDTEGTTTQSSTSTFSTLAATVTVSNLPSGSNYDTRPERILTWTLKSGDYDVPQESATFYWRKSGDSVWQSISVTGNTKSLTIPANTFPNGVAVERYFSCTPKGSDPITLSTVSFTTASTKITPIVYPSGRKVESGQLLTFSWAFRNTLGDYDQGSAKLCWRASTSAPYQEIAVTGTEQSITVPKNTFPGNGSTVYWHLEGTDIGGCSSTTNDQNFTTVTSKITPQNCPTSGYADPRAELRFSWYFATETASYDQASASFFWREVGAETWTEVQDAQNTGGITIAANTFPVASEIEWYIAGTDAGGCSSQSAVYTISTTASTAYAVCQSPVGRVEDGTKPITFRWIVQNSDGTAPTAMFLWWKLPTESSSQWHQIFSTTEQIFEYTVPENTFDAGPVQWRVQAVNRDGVGGPVSEASFVVLRAPDAPSGLSATAVPRTTISWQATGQEAYEVSIDGQVVAAEYGPAVYHYQQETPLEDGVHSIRVRVQGSHGLWSNYSETSILVENTPDGVLELSGAFGIDAVLTVRPAADEETAYQWYRDGKRIAQTVGTSTFTDRFAVGGHQYYAEVWHSDGNYTRSNTIEGAIEVTGPVIAAAAGGDWLSLQLSENDSEYQMFSRSRTSATHHITAAAYPILEISSFEDLTGSYNCSFSDPEQARAFEALFGKVVILKSRRGHMIIGGLIDLSNPVKEFYNSYSFSIQQTNWEDFVDGQNG